MKYTFTEEKDTRSGFGAGLLELGKKNPNVVALTSDLTGSLKMNDFENEKQLESEFKNISRKLSSNL